MFAASILICAIEANIVIYDRCHQVNDTWGPYSTLEQCNIRLYEMNAALLIPEIRIEYWKALGYPSAIVKQNICLPVGELT